MTLKTQLKAVIRAALLLAALPVAACSGGHDSSETVTIGGAPDLAMLVVLAQDQGYFDANGVDVTYTPVQTGKIAYDALGTRDLDMAVVVDTNIAFGGYSGGSDVRVLASIQAQVGDAIIARSDSGIAYPADLAGKRIGYLPATTSHVFLDRFLTANGLSVDDVTLLSMAPPAMQSAVVRGDVDAVSLFHPFRIGALDALGDNGVEFAAGEVYTAQAMMAVRAGAIEEQSDAFAAVLRALNQASDFASEHSGEANEILAEALELDIATMARIRSDFDLSVSFNDNLLDLVREEGEWIRTTQPEFEGRDLPDYNVNFDSSVFQAVQN